MPPEPAATISPQEIVLFLLAVGSLILNGVQAYLARPDRAVTLREKVYESQLKACEAVATWAQEAHRLIVFGFAEASTPSKPTTEERNALAEAVSDHLGAYYRIVSGRRFLIGASVDRAATEFLQAAVNAVSQEDASEPIKTMRDRLDGIDAAMAAHLRVDAISETNTRLVGKSDAEKAADSAQREAERAADAFRKLKRATDLYDQRLGKSVKQNAEPVLTPEAADAAQRVVREAGREDERRAEDQQ
jgi:hypothetical protein